MTAAEQREAIRLVEESDLSARRTLRELQLPRTTFYRWYRRDRAAGGDRSQRLPSTTGPRRDGHSVPRGYGRPGNCADRLRDR